MTTESNPVPDKNAPDPVRAGKIWGDCPQCAYKHLAAAHAWLTSGLEIEHAHLSEIAVARALIALTEVRAGYVGNVDLASGCLAMAETDAGAEDAEAAAWRGARLLISSGMPGDAARELVWPGPGAWAAANVVEALREFPRLREFITVPDYITIAGFDPDADLVPVITDALAWLRRTYEIGAHPEAVS